jgi:hypothetical protein
MKMPAFYGLFRSLAPLCRRRICSLAQEPRRCGRLSSLPGSGRHWAAKPSQRRGKNRENGHDLVDTGETQDACGRHQSGMRLRRPTHRASSCAQLRFVRGVLHEPIRDRFKLLRHGVSIAAAALLKHARRSRLTCIVKGAQSYHDLKLGSTQPQPRA